MKSAKEHKLKTYIDKNLNVHDVNNEKYLKMDKLSEQNKNSNKSKLKILTQNKNQNKLNYYSQVLMKNLYKHNSIRSKYFSKVITDIIYDEKKHIVCLFKEYLLWDENSEFLKRFYFVHESNERIPKISGYYEQYTVMKPVYFHLACHKIMLKNVRKLKKYKEIIEANEDRQNQTEEIQNNKEFSKFIKTVFINTSSERTNKEKSVINNEEMRIVESKLTDQEKLNLHLIYNNKYTSKFILKNSYTEILKNDSSMTSFNYCSILSNFKNIKEDKNFEKSHSNSNFIPNLTKTEKHNSNNEIISIPLDLQYNSSVKQHNIFTKVEMQKESIMNKNPENGKITLVIPIRIPEDNQKSNGKQFRKIQFNKLDLKNIKNGDIERLDSKQKNLYNHIKTNSSTKRFLNKEVKKDSKVIDNLNQQLSKKNSISKNNPNSKPNIEINVKTQNALIRFNTKQLINTKELKEKFNIVENMLKTLRDNSDNKKQVSKDKLKNLNLNESKVKTNKISPVPTKINKNHSKQQSIKTTKTNENKTTDKNILTENKNNNIDKNNLNENKYNDKSNLNENSHKILNNFMNSNLNLANHIKTVSQPEISKRKTISNPSSKTKNNTNTNSNYNTKPTSFYNINFNLNLNVNMNTFKNKNSTNNSNSKAITEKSMNIPHTERPSMLGNKIDKILEKADKMTLANLKANEKYEKLSRNMNVKNFILNYGGVINNSVKEEINMKNPVNHIGNKDKNKRPRNVILVNSNMKNKQFSNSKETENNLLNTKYNYGTNPSSAKISLIGPSNFNYSNKRYLTNCNTNGSNDNYNSDTGTSKHINLLNTNNINSIPVSGTVSSSNTNNFNTNTKSTSNNTNNFNYSSMNNNIKATLKNIIYANQKPLSINLKKCNLDEKIKQPLSSRINKKKIKLK